MPEAIIRDGDRKSAISSIGVDNFSTFFFFKLRHRLGHTRVHAARIFESRKPEMASKIPEIFYAFGP